MYRNRSKSLLHDTNRHSTTPAGLLTAESLE